MNITIDDNLLSVNLFLVIIFTITVLSNKRNQYYSMHWGFISLKFFEVWILRVVIFHIYCYHCSFLFVEQLIIFFRNINAIKYVSHKYDINCEHTRWIGNARIFVCIENHYSFVGYDFPNRFIPIRVNTVYWQEIKNISCISATIFKELYATFNVNIINYVMNDDPFPYTWYRL